ncbi:unnamed protein product [Orchesella dallaii]|uniref:Mediator of RNA polymerase II transcription subunit 27 n=1 Tax=Orchesella dallaii TaxID=48710 RepID=A0ABP1QWH9_9HEXA
MSDSTLDTLHKSLDVIKILRCNMTGFFQLVGAGFRIDGTETDSQEDREKATRAVLIAETQKLKDNFTELEQAVLSLSHPAGPFNLGNTLYVNQEVAPDRVPLYTQLVDSYKWMEKVHEYSGTAYPVLSQNSLKRTYFNASISAKRRRSLVNSYIVAPEAVNSAIMGFSNSFNDIDIQILRPLGSNAVLNIILGRTLRSVAILKGWLIEWVVIRGFNEDMTKEDGTLNLWSESKYKVFQKVTDNANAAMLHFCAPTHPELSVKSFLTWLHSYITLFTQPCKKCGLHLSNNLPPTWRDLRTLDPYHEECKP